MATMSFSGPRRSPGEGYYFYVQLDRVPPPDGRLILEVVREENRPPERFDFSLKLLPRGWFGELVLGLTGRDAGPPRGGPSPGASP